MPICLEREERGRAGMHACHGGDADGCASVGARGGGRRRGGGAGAAPMKPQGAGDHRLHFAPVDDRVEEALFEQELAALEPVGQLLADGLLDDARARRSRSAPWARRC